jgi:hypothetical protein
VRKNTRCKVQNSDAIRVCTMDLQARLSRFSAVADPLVRAILCLGGDLDGKVWAAPAYCDYDF